MHNKLKLLSLSLLVTLLFGCGLADPSDPIEEDPDTTPPIITEIREPLNLTSNGLPVNTRRIVLKVSEQLDASKNNLDALNKIEIKSTTGNVLEGEWRFDGEEELLIFDIKSTNIPHSQTYRLIIDEQITDLAENKLKFDISFSTAAVYDVLVTATGLLPNQSAEIEFTNVDASSQDTNSIKIPVDANNVSFRIDSNITQNTEYLLKVSQQPADGSFCTFNKAQGKMANKDAQVQLFCSRIGPFRTDAPNWNDYYKISNDEPLVHGGEKRSMRLTEASSCAGITAVDDLKAFDWLCDDSEIDANNNPIVKIYTLGLKVGKNLSDLLTISGTPSWKQNSLAVTGPGFTTKTSSSIWWNNPVYIAPAQETLNIEGAIYVIPKNVDTLPQNYVFAADKIALIVSPVYALTSKTDNNAAIAVERPDGNWLRYPWIEGEIDANSSVIGIKLNKVLYAQLRNLNLRNANGNGIQIRNSISYISNSKSTKNSGHGISIGENSFAGFASTIDNVVVANNDKSGLYVNGSYNLITRIQSAHNKTNGVRIGKPKNVFSDIQISNNNANGLLIEDSHNNIINQLTASSNDEAGIRFSQNQVAPQNNLIANASVTNNKGAGIRFDNVISQVSIDSNRLIGILDAFNNASTCGSFACMNTTSVTTDDAALDGLFTLVSNDGNFANFPSNGVNIYEAYTKLKFDNKFRAWGSILTLTSLSNISGAGSCNHPEISGIESTCQILDWSVNANDVSFALNKIPNPDAIDNFTFYSSSETLSYLNHSMEIIGDQTGNDNGICEAAETCVITPNIGSYQGHGALVKIEDNTEANSNNINLFTFESNGR